MLITKQKNILFVGEDIAHELDDTTLTAEKMYSINFTASKKEISFEFAL